MKSMGMLTMRTYWQRKFICVRQLELLSVFNIALCFDDNKQIHII